MTGTTPAVFITGASGFVGAAVLRHLVAGNIPVRALVRSPEGSRAVALLGAEPVPGDLADAPRLREAMAGASRVFHVAGVNELCPRSVDALYQTNVAGTRRVVAAAAEAGVPRVVVTSSVTAGPGTHSAYARSKALAETAAFETGSRFDIDVVVVRPASVQGPGRVDGSARLLRYLLARRYPPVADTTISVVDVDDCARSHLLAAQHGRPGTAYVVSAGWLDTREAVAVVAEAASRVIRPVVLPGPLIRALAFGPALAGEVWPRIGFCREMLATLLSEHRHDGTEAARELGFSYLPPAATLERAVWWLLGPGAVSV